MNNSYALITGASRGIGKAFAQQLAAKNYNLILVARTETDLKTLAADLKSKYKIEVETIIKDLANTSAADEIYDFCVTKKLPVSILINNAGYAVWGGFEQSDLQQQQAMLNVMLNNLVALCHRFIPLLKQNPKSYLLNVSSTTQYQAVPYMSVYAAAKAFVLQFSRALKIELQLTSVSVSCLVPGTTDTGFIDRADMNDNIRKQAKKVEMTPDAVAAIGLKGMFAGKAEIIPGFINWISSMATYFLPKMLPEKIAEKIYKP